MNHAMATQITPDYSLLVEEVYMQAVIAVIKPTKILPILRLGYFMNETNPRKCPSWVPDFSKLGNRAFVGGVFATGILHSEFELNESRRNLRVRGRVLVRLISLFMMNFLGSWMTS
jgi:hypothetical protein